MKNFAYTLLCLNFAFSLLQVQVALSLQDVTRSIENLKNALSSQAKELKDGGIELNVDEIEFNSEMHWKEEDKKGIVKNIVRMKFDSPQDIQEEEIKEKIKNIISEINFLVVKKIINEKEVEIASVLTQSAAMKMVEGNPTTETMEVLETLPPVNVPLEIFYNKVKVLLKKAGRELKEFQLERGEIPKPLKTNLSFYNRCKSRRLRMS